MRLKLAVYPVFKHTDLPEYEEERGELVVEAVEAAL